MSNVTSCVLHLAAGTSKTIVDDIESKVFTSHRGIDQCFERIPLNNYETPEGEDRAGGSVAFGSDVYAAAFNYIFPAEILDWFEKLPFMRYDFAVLSIDGNDESFVANVNADGDCEIRQVLS